VLAFAGVVILAILVIPAYGYYATFVAPPRRTAVEVNGVKHSLGEVAKISKSFASASGGGQTDLSTLPLQIVNNLITEELVAQRAPELGITVAQDEVDAEVRSRHYPTPREGQQTNPEALEREYKETLRSYLDMTKYTIGEYREIVRRSLLRYKLLEILAEQIPGVQEQVFVHWIHVQDDSQVLEIKQRLADGEEFDRLARVYSMADPYADENGEVGWIPVDAFPLFDSTLLSLELDKVSDPVSNPPDTYFLKITAGPELADVSPDMRALLKTRVLEKWINEQFEPGKNDIKLNFGSKEYEWVIDQVRELIPAPTPQTS
jgi:parvulin-like peptidyl-prolyl isomerase